MKLGLDLGTSNSVVAGFHDGKMTVFRPDDGGETLPSVIWIDKRGHRTYGRRAYDKSLIEPDNAASGFKRLLGTSTPLEIKGAKVNLTPEECTADIIKQLLAQASMATGDATVSQAVVTIPAAFNQMQSEATLRATTLAGLEVVQLLQEPIAAALAALEGKPRDGQFLVYDFGGGTFDVAIARAQNGHVTIVAHQGVNMLGGRDFDRTILQRVVRPWLEETFDLPDNFHRAPDYTRLMRLARLAAERAKIDLSTRDETVILAAEEEIRLTDRQDAELRLEIPLTRKAFEGLIETSVRQTVTLIRNLFDENALAATDMDRIVFIGGSSRIPLVRTMVCNELNLQADLSTDPMTAVACGAAWHALGLAVSGTVPVRDVVRDETPQSSLDDETGWEEDDILDIENLLQDTPRALSGGDTGNNAEESAAVARAAEKGLSFTFLPSTTEDRIVLTMRVTAALEDSGSVILETENWQSDSLPLIDEMTILAPLPTSGAHVFRVRVVDNDDAPRDDLTHSLRVTRLIPTVGGIAAVHTIAIKARETTEATDNVLIPLVTRGDPLPKSGETLFHSAHVLESGHRGSLSLELFQVEYPERVDLNLCVGLFRLEAHDLPEGTRIKRGDRVLFAWTMSKSGILQARVKLPDSGIELTAPRFYAPQAGQISFQGETGIPFARSVLSRGQDEWGDLAAALGPDAPPELATLKQRLDDQDVLLDDSVDDPETLRRVVEEARFIRQDIARQASKHTAPVLQRRLGKMQIVFNRLAHSHATPEEVTQFNDLSIAIQDAIDSKVDEQLAHARTNLIALRALFFTAAWRNPDYARSWYTRLAEEPWLFPDRAEFDALVTQGKSLMTANDLEGLRTLVGKMLDLRIALSASDAAGEPASIVRG